MLPDLINGLFEAALGIASWLNVLQIMRDKQVRGVTSATTWIASIWGFYNLYYYPHLHQWYSLAGGCVVVIGNAMWCVFAWRYRKS